MQGLSCPDPGLGLPLPLVSVSDLGWFQLAWDELSQREQAGQLWHRSLDHLTGCCLIKLECPIMGQEGERYCESRGTEK